MSETTTALAKNSRFIAYVNDRNLTLAIQSTNVGELNTTPPEMPTRYADIPFPGDVIEYPDLTINYLVDEDFEVWYDVLEWIQDSVKQNRMHEDLEVVFLDSQFQPTMSVVYHNCIPMATSQIDVTISEEESILTSTVTIAYSHFTVKDKKRDRELQFYDK